MQPSGWQGVEPFVLLLPWAAAVCLWAVLRVAESDGVKVRRVVWMQLGFSVLAVGGAKLFSIVERGGQLGSFSGELAGGWRYSGGLLGLVVGIAVLRPWLLPGVSWRRYADWIAPAFALGHGVMRVSCFMNGCCTGGVCPPPWGVSFPPGSGVAESQLAEGVILHPTFWSQPVFPLHLAFMITAFAIGVGLMQFDRRRQYDGQVFLLFLALHEGSKFTLELFRHPAELNLQIAAAVPAALGIVALAVIELRRMPAARTDHA